MTDESSEMPDAETLDQIAALCRFMIAWADREPDSILPDPLGLFGEDTP